MNYDDIYYFQQEHRLSDSAIQFMLDLLANNGFNPKEVLDIKYFPKTDLIEIYTSNGKLCIRKEWLRRIN